MLYVYVSAAVMCRCFLVRYLIAVKATGKYSHSMAKESTINRQPKTSDGVNGKGWHGDSEGHARAGRKGGKASSGNFKNNPQRAVAAGRVGGRVSPGNFKNNPERA